MNKEECEHYWVLAEPQAVGHVTQAKIKCIKCPKKGAAHLI